MGRDLLCTEAGLAAVAIGGQGRVVGWVALVSVADAVEGRTHHHGRLWTRMNDPRLTAIVLDSDIQNQPLLLDSKADVLSSRLTMSLRVALCYV